MNNCDITAEAMSLTTRTSFLHEIQSGDENAWQDFYRRYSAMIEDIGRKRQLTEEECHDLMIDVMVIFWKKVDEYLALSPRGRFRSYLAKLANYRALKIFSNKHRDRLAAEDSAAVDYPADVDSAYMEEWRDFIWKRALEELQNSVDTDTYQVFYMNVVQKRPVEEIAAVTRKSRNNIYVIRFRCLKKLKKLIARYRQCDEAELIR